MEPPCGWYFIIGRCIMTPKNQHFEVKVIDDLKTCVSFRCHGCFIYVSQGIHFLWLNFTVAYMLVWFENILNLNEHISTKAVGKDWIYSSMEWQNIISKCRLQSSAVLYQLTKLSEPKMISKCLCECYITLPCHQ